jgi:hypothetical protein
MIGKITIGKSFSGCIKYCLEDKIQKQNQEPVLKNRAEVFMFNNCFGNRAELVQQFNEVRQLNTKVSKPVLHITLSLAPREDLGKDKLMEMCGQCAKEMGFENNQFIAVSHRDTGHQHIHIVANRIGFDTKTVSDSNSYQKIANYCRKMELKYDFKQVLNPRKYLPKEQRNIPRFDQRKEQLRKHITEALKGCKHFNEFEWKMKAKGYEITKGRGISFTDEKKVKVKGSEVIILYKQLNEYYKNKACYFQNRLRKNISYLPHHQLLFPLRSLYQLKISVIKNKKHCLTS